VTSTTPKSLFSCKASQTASDPSTILFLQGGKPACSLSHPFFESHSSTTLASTLLPFRAVIFIIFPHLDPPAYQPVDSATTRSVFSWKFSSHSDGAPPSSPSLKSLSVRLALVKDVTGGEHVNRGKDFPSHLRVPEGLQSMFEGGEGLSPVQVWVPTWGSSLHFPLMQMSWRNGSAWRQWKRDDGENEGKRHKRHCVFHVCVCFKQRSVHLFTVQKLGFYILQINSISGKR